MRNPAQSVTRVPGWEHTGWRLSRLLNDEVSRSPALTQALDAMTSEKDRDSAVPALQEQLEKAGLRVAAAMAASLGRPQAASTLGPTGWRWQLLEAILIHAGDPDVDVARWLDGHTPLGIKSEIVYLGEFSLAQSRRQLNWRLGNFTEGELVRISRRTTHHTRKTLRNQQANLVG